MDRVKKAKELCEDASKLIKEANRPLPERWEVGQRVRFIRTEDWAFIKGTEATIVDLDENCKNKKADEYQVFWAEPDNKKACWWVTPDDVELVI